MQSAWLLLLVLAGLAEIGSPRDCATEIDRAVLLIGPTFAPEAENEAERVRAVVAPPKVQKLVRLLAPLDHPPRKFAAGYILEWELKLYAGDELVRTVIFGDGFKIGNSGHGDCFTSQELQETLRSLIGKAEE